MQRHRTILGVVLAVVLYATIASSPTHASRAKKVPCRDDIGNCPPEGCGTDFDPNLNKRKNIRPSDQQAAGDATPHPLTWMKKLKDPEEFAKGDTREELETLGEGQKISVVAWLLRVKPE